MRDHGADFVLLRVVAVRRFDVTDERGAEHLLTGAHRLQRDARPVEDGRNGPLLERVGGAVDVEPVGTRRDLAAFQHDLVRLDALHATAPDHVPDPPQLREFGLRHRGAAIHRRPHALVEAQQHAALVRAREEVVHRGGAGDRLHLLRGSSFSGTQRTPGAIAYCGARTEGTLTCM